MRFNGKQDSVWTALSEAHSQGSRDQETLIRSQLGTSRSNPDTFNHSNTGHILGTGGIRLGLSPRQQGIPTIDCAPDI